MIVAAEGVERGRRRDAALVWREADGRPGGGLLFDVLEALAIHDAVCVIVVLLFVAMFVTIGLGAPTETVVSDSRQYETDRLTGCSAGGGRTICVDDAN